MRVKAQVCENLGNHGRIFNCGDECQGGAALRTGGHVDLEHPFEQLGPAGIG